MSKEENSSNSSNKQLSLAMPGINVSLPIKCSVFAGLIGTIRACCHSDFEQETISDETEYENTVDMYSLMFESIKAAYIDYGCMQEQDFRFHSFVQRRSMYVKQSDIIIRAGAAAVKKGQSFSEAISTVLCAVTISCKHIVTVKNALRFAFLMYYGVGDSIYGIRKLAQMLDYTPNVRNKDSFDVMYQALFAGDSLKDIFAAAQKKGSSKAVTIQAQYMLSMLLGLLFNRKSVAECLNQEDKKSFAEFAEGIKRTDAKPAELEASLKLVNDFSFNIPKLEMASHSISVRNRGIDEIDMDEILLYAFCEDIIRDNSFFTTAHIYSAKGSSDIAFICTDPCYAAGTVEHGMWEHYSPSIIHSIAEKTDIIIINEYLPANGNIRPPLSSYFSSDYKRKVFDQLMYERGKCVKQFALKVDNIPVADLYLTFLDDGEKPPEFPCDAPVVNINQFRKAGRSWRSVLNEELRAALECDISEQGRFVVLMDAIRESDSQYMRNSIAEVLAENVKSILSEQEGMNIVLHTISADSYESLELYGRVDEAEAAPSSKAEQLSWTADAYYTLADYSKAVKLYKKSADMGYPRAMASLGESIYNGRGAKADKEKGEQLLRQAAELNDAVGIYMLGDIELARGSRERAKELYFHAYSLTRSDADMGDYPYVVSRLLDFFPECFAEDEREYLRDELKRAVNKIEKEYKFTPDFTPITEAAK